MSKKDEQYEMRKWQILNIALDHFIKYGFYGTSTRKIANDAKISSGLMFHYFPTKESLYETLVEIGTQEINMDINTDLSALEFFEIQIDWFLRIINNNDFSTKMFVFMGLAAINSKEISLKALKMIEDHDIERLSVPYIEKGQKEGQIRQGDPLTLSVLFYSSLQGLAETMMTRKKLKLPKKEWFLSLLKNDNKEEKK